MSSIRHFITNLSKLVIGVICRIGDFLKEGRDDGMLLDVDHRDWEKMPIAKCDD